MPTRATILVLFLVAILPLSFASQHELRTGTSHSDSSQSGNSDNQPQLQAIKQRVHALAHRIASEKYEPRLERAVNDHGFASFEVHDHKLVHKASQYPTRVRLLRAYYGDTLHSDRTYNWFQKAMPPSLRRQQTHANLKDLKSPQGATRRFFAQSHHLFGRPPPPIVTGPAGRSHFDPGAGEHLARAPCAAPPPPATTRPGVSGCGTVTAGRRGPARGPSSAACRMSLRLISPP